MQMFKKKKINFGLPPLKMTICKISSSYYKLQLTSILVLKNKGKSRWIIIIFFILLKK